MLRWLKLWDHVVFGIELKPSTRNQSQANEAKLKKRDGFLANKKPGDGEVNNLIDDSNRPIQKVCINIVTFGVLQNAVNSCL